MNHAFSKIWILVILVVFIVGGILAWQYFGVLKEEGKDETADSSSKALATEDWQTYRNKEYGFEVRYPRNWNVDLGRAPSYIRFDINNDNYLTEEEYKVKGGIYYDDRYIDDIKIEVFSSLTALSGNERGLSLQEWINDRKKSYLVGYQEEVQIGEYKGVEIQEMGIITWRSIFYAHNALIYNFEIIEEHPEMSNFNQMLSTFRLVEPLKITITSPAKGEKWMVDETYQIRWIPTNPNEVVEIRLNDASASTAALTNVWAKANIPNTGEYSFTVPTNFPLSVGNVYQIGILNITHGYTDAPEGYSELFSIVIE